MTAEGQEFAAPVMRHYSVKPGVRALGWREWLAIPEWGIARIKAKIDTGARTSSVHADNLHYFTRGGVDMVRFKIRPHQRSSRHIVTIETPIVDKRVVRSSSGEEDLRPVVRTHVELHGVCWTLEMTLAKRKLMGFRMLLGREAMWERFIVDPSRSFLGGEPCMPFEDSSIQIRAKRKVKTRPDEPGHISLELAPEADTSTKARAK